MRLLVDTHAALWWLLDDPRLPERASRAIADPEAEVLLSAVVVWEVAIKRELGKLKAPEDLVRRLVDDGARPLPVTLEHAGAVEGLPPHHRDPFDRLLVAQARLEGAVLVTGDPIFGAYGGPVLW